MMKSTGMIPYSPQIAMQSILAKALRGMTDAEFDRALDHSVQAIRAYHVGCEAAVIETIIHHYLFDALIDVLAHGLDQQAISTETMKDTLLKPVALVISPPVDRPAWPPEPPSMGKVSEPLPMGLFPKTSAPSDADNRVIVNGESWVFVSIRGDGNCFPRSVVTGLFSQSSPLNDREWERLRQEYQKLDERHQPQAIESAMMTLKSQMAANKPDYTEGVVALSGYIHHWHDASNLDAIQTILQTMVPYELVHHVYRQLVSQNPQDRQAIARIIDSFDTQRAQLITEHGTYLGPGDSSMMTSGPMTECWHEYSTPGLFMPITLLGVTVFILKRSGHYDALLKPDSHTTRRLMGG